MKKKLTLIFTLLIFIEIANAQNLVPNPGFEDYFSTFCGIMQPSDFNQTIKDWKNPTFASPSAYFTNIDQTCYNFQPDSQYGGPIGLKGTQLPRTGEVMTGIWVYTIDGLNQRQYLQAQLDTPMEMGKAYIVSFYVSLGDYIEKSINGLGAHLSLIPIGASDDGPLNFTPQILENDFINETSEWILISDTIIAQDDYNYLTIGNFFDDNSTSTMPNPTASGQPGTYGAYYFVDDVSVVETIITTNTHDIEDHLVEIFPNPVQNEINIHLPEIEYEVLIKLFNNQGLEVYEATFKNQSAVKIDSSNLPAGAYFIQVQSRSYSLTKKIVKY